MAGRAAAFFALRSSALVGSSVWRAAVVVARGERGLASESSKVTVFERSDSGSPKERAESASGAAVPDCSRLVRSSAE